eukprot:TRINITY_DN11595_c0_g1_i2.p1 TRINITY_DN11595_c0_g1~~TRINITY_DN11595_c0_g1_i2.p1  ORF type:complete len:465 (-),score=58.22 TRINITY_DN11595_c0_g1_i2:169-1563(-)
MQVTIDQIQLRDGVHYYHYTVKAGAQSHSFGQRFSEYNKIHKRLQQADCPVPSFPSKHVFGSVDPVDRSKELCTWLTGCLRSSSILLHPVFHQLFRFSPAMIVEFRKIADARRQAPRAPSQSPSGSSRGSTDKSSQAQGSRLSGVSTRFRFSPHDIIGQGGYGKTYLGIDNLNHNAKGVGKEFSPHNSGGGRLTEADKDMFRKEANQLQLLGDHPKIPKLLGYFETERSLYLIQELVEGLDLNKMVHSRGTFSEPSVWKLMVQILYILKYTHDSRNPAGGVVHRDIKPSNIMKRAADGDYLLIDFGCAKRVVSVAQGQATSIGTPGYQAPETNSGRIFYASDLYSLGATCTFLMSAQEPCYMAPPGISGWREYAKIRPSEGLAAVIDKMLQVNPRNRYATAGQALDEINELFAHQNLLSPTMQYPDQMAIFSEALNDDLNRVSAERLSPQAPGEGEEDDEFEEI